MPCSAASLYRRCVSRKFELPPSTIVSPLSASCSRSWKTSSVTLPAGTIIQNARGASSCDFSSSSEVAVRDSTAGSYVATSWPASRRRSVMPFPMRPRPIIPSCIPLCLLESDSGDAASAFLQSCIISRRLGSDQAPEAERAVRDRQLVARIVDELQVEAAVRAALVQLPGGVEVARPVPARDDEAGAAAELPREVAKPAVILGARLDEGLNADVVAAVRLCEQLVG